jgi:ABC-type dipeptide/oligopeptide/nickel transport system ATPase component
MDLALEIENLSVALADGGREIVRDISFAVPGGSTVALIGESGCGKTITSMAIMGLLPPGIVQTGGKITIGGLDTSSLTAEQYRQLRNTGVSIVMQNPMSAFDPVFSIFYHFHETLHSHGHRNKRENRTIALEVLKDVGFAEPKDILDLYPFQMSGGMLQRVMLALALIASPPLIIADEATSDLDVLSQARILRLLKKHCDSRHLALLLITHDLSVAAEMADNVVVMKDGVVLEKKPVGEFFKNPQTPYAAMMLELHRGLYTPRYRNIIANLAKGVA